MKITFRTDAHRQGRDLRATCSAFLTPVIFFLTLSAQAARMVYAADPPVQTKAGGTAPEPLLHSTFVTGTDGWASAGKDGKIAQTTEDTKPALRWDYSLQKGGFSVLVQPVTPNALARAKAFRFAIKCPTQTPVVMVLQERTGGRYLATFSVPAGAWQTVELAPADFVLAEGKDDPKDANHTLDMDQVENIALADFTQLLLQSDDMKMANLFNVKAGDKHLFLADFTVSGSGPEVSGYDAVGGRLDTFAHPQAGWLSLNTTSLLRIGSGVQAAYHQSGETPTVLVRGFPPALLTGKTRLSLALQSRKPAKIVLQLESRSGNKWKVLFDIAGQNTRKTWSFAFSEFAPDEENKPVDGKTEIFDPAQIHQITLVDISGITDGAIDDNTLAVSGLVVK